MHSRVNPTDRRPHRPLHSRWFGLDSLSAPRELKPALRRSVQQTTMLLLVSTVVLCHNFLCSFLGPAEISFYFAAFPTLARSWASFPSTASGAEHDGLRRHDDYENGVRTSTAPPGPSGRQSRAAQLLYPWESFHEQVVECEVCQATSELLVSRLREILPNVPYSGEGLSPTREDSEAGHPYVREVVASALDSVIDERPICTFWNWKQYADKTEDINTLEMTAECKKQLQEGKNEYRAALLEHPADARKLAREACLETMKHCTALWEDHDLPDARESKAERNKRLSRAFLEWNRDQPGISVSPLGVQYRWIRRKTDDHASIPRADTDVVHMHYLGKRLSGKTFFNTFRTGKAAVAELKSLVPGWREVLMFMRNGEELHAYIPPEVGFGEAGLNGKVGPNEVVMLHIRLEFIEHKEAQQAGPAPGALTDSRAADETLPAEDGLSKNSWSHDEL